MEDTSPQGIPASGEAPLGDLRHSVDAVLADPALQEPTAHTERMALLVALLSEALRRYGMVATLVGGGALEFYAPGGYVTYDIDLVVQSQRGLLDRETLDSVFGRLGFDRRGRHWVREDVFIEVPGTYMEDPVEQHQVGPYSIRVVKPEVVLVGRLVEFDQTGHTGHGAQAVLLLRVMGAGFDRTLLDGLLRRERCERVYTTLRQIAESDAPVTDSDLRATWEELHDGDRLHGIEESEEGEL